MHKRKRAGNTITRKINSTKDTAAKADKNHYISNSYLEGFIPIDTEYFTASGRRKNRWSHIWQPSVFFGVKNTPSLCLCRYPAAAVRNNRPRSALGDSAGRACACAGTAGDAGISIDHVLSVSLGDCAYRALSLAGSAAYTRVADYICHSFILL